MANALTTLDEQERGTARLKEAVAAYCEVLQELTLEREPLHWALAQNNLGNSSESSASGRARREKISKVRFEEAAAAFRKALEVYSREVRSHEWATTMVNLGHVYEILGERERDTAQLEKAVATFHEALEELPRNACRSSGPRLRRISALRLKHWANWKAGRHGSKRPLPRSLDGKYPRTCASQVGRDPSRARLGSLCHLWQVLRAKSPR